MIVKFFFHCYIEHCEDQVHVLVPGSIDFAGFRGNRGESPVANCVEQCVKIVLFMKSTIRQCSTIYLRSKSH